MNESDDIPITTVYCDECWQKTPMATKEKPYLQPPDEYRRQQPCSICGQLRYVARVALDLNAVHRRFKQCENETT